MTARRLGVSVVVAAFLCATRVDLAFACARAFAQHRVSGSFEVQIAYNGRPLEGVELKLSRETRKEPYFVDVLSAKSDQNGEILINGLAPDAYFLEVKHAGVYGEAVELKVVGQNQQDSLVEERFKLNWPDRKVFKVREIAGKLVRTAFDNTIHAAEPPLAGTKLTLVDAFPGTQRSTSAVQKDGRFVFLDIEPGLYIVRVKQSQGGQISTDPEEIDGDIFVEVVRDAPEKQLPLLRLYMTDCGLGMRGEDGNEIF